MTPSGEGGTTKNRVSHPSTAKSSINLPVGAVVSPNPAVYNTEPNSTRNQKEQPIKPKALAPAAKVARGFKVNGTQQNLHTRNTQAFVGSPVPKQNKKIQLTGENPGMDQLTASAGTNVSIPRPRFEKMPFKDDGADDTEGTAYGSARGDFYK